MVCLLADQRNERGQAHPHPGNPQARHRWEDHVNGCNTTAAAISSNNGEHGAAIIILRMNYLITMWCRTVVP
jgi:hypothetical protein